ERGSVVRMAEVPIRGIHLCRTSSIAHIVRGWRALLPLLCLAVALFSRPATAEEIQLTKRGGTYSVPVRINDALTLDFVLDTGAADVSIPADVVMTLVRTGTVATGDFVGKATYVLADGSKLPSLRFLVSCLAWFFLCPFGMIRRLRI